MEVTLPIKRLNSLSWLLAVIASIIVYIVLAQDPTQRHKFLGVTESITGIALIGHIDVLCMVILVKKYGIKTKKFNQYRYLITFPASIVAYLLIWPVFFYLQQGNWAFWEMRQFLALVGSGPIVNAMVIVLHDSVLLYEHKLHTDLELSRLKTANAEASNLLLKQQIHPHFLFNALNTLKALYNKDVYAGDTYLVHLSDFLRASITHQASQLSRLEDEVKLLNDYLEMQRIRFGTALDCTIVLPDETLQDYYLPSFSLQPLLENALKHNDLTKQTPLKVHIFQKDDRVIVTNNLQKKKMLVPSTNSGLANLAERYRLWSGDSVIINEDQNSFTVSIKLLKK